MDSIKPEPNGFDNGCDSNPKEALNAKSDIPETHDTERLAADYEAALTKVAKAMKHATGYGSIELLKLGDVLYLAREWPKYNDLGLMKQLMSNNSLMSTNDITALIDSIQDIMSSLCFFIEDLSGAGLQDLAKKIKKKKCTLTEANEFLERLDQFGRQSVDEKRATGPIIPISDVKAVLCAEIWCITCDWAHRDRMPFPSLEEFIEIMRPHMAEGMYSNAKIFVLVVRSGIALKSESWISIII
ncbi:hypothetical protein F5Y10DRAFT_284976 [Nemania abortiva]|nr:hypothetical protein F5Y10DRAFT_284976 [Nemania abortiva]